MADDATPLPTHRILDLQTMGDKAGAASRSLAELSPEQRTEGLRSMAAHIRAQSAHILSENAADVAEGREKGLSSALVDRLTLSEERLEGMASGIEAVAALPDPVGRQLARWTVPSGLDIARVACPLGVIAIIYESRPNVTADAGALCVRSGNAAVLRCGSESKRSSSAIVEAMQAGLRAAGLPEHAVQLVPTQDRAAVGAILTGLDGRIDVVVPRGGKGLVARVQDEARVPVIGHLEGICHTYIDAAADRDMALRIAVNAKMRRTGICGATETILIHKDAADTFGPELISELITAGCEVRGDEAAQALNSGVKRAEPEDWSTEYLDAIVSLCVVDTLDTAIAHITQYGTGHTEAIITSDPHAAETFLNTVDASIVMQNASTQFADGGEFGMGAEIGIATGRIHARGPVGAEQLTIFKYVVRGTGQTRP